MLKHHTYDGLGRLICTQSPFPDPDTAQAGHVRSERFFYDGVRRIQEVSVTPMIAAEAALGSGDPVLEQLAAASLDPGSDADGAAAPLALEQGLTELSGNDPPPWPTNTHLARE